jgi:7-keto-8-aminopelargonate synthetase-like enzyme
MGLKPKRVRRRQRIYSGFVPPHLLIATAMDLAMMRAAQRHRKLIAHLAAERARLHEAEVMGV